MKVLVVGGGGREHVICWKLKQDPRVTDLYCAPGNGGIASIATCVDIKATDIEGMVEYAKKEQFDLVFVAPDDPLAMGMVDKMEEAGLRAFGPKANAAIIEGSKAFSKQLMKKYSIPTAKYEIFEDEQKALDYLETQPMPIVIKCDGLALGKGVIIAQTLDEAKQAVKDMMEDQKFGSAGSTIVIEECMTGPELTVLAFSDGNTCVPMVSSRDHKRAYDHDEGLNTGGMGAVTPGADMTDELKARIQNEIINHYSIMPNLSQKTSLRGSYLTSSPTERQARTGTASPSKATYLLPMCSPVCAPCAAASASNDLGGTRTSIA